jgi:hypothetical protein
MPRKARPNRTDMLAQPVKTATGGKYGAAQASAQAQQAVPLAQTAPVGGAPPDMARVLPQAQAFQMPAPLNAPTNNPNEPVTHGMMGGPGGGSEVLDQPGPDGLLIKGLAALQALGDSADPATKQLLAYAEATLSQKRNM